MSIKRFAVQGLSLSAVALVALLSREGFTDKAIIPTKGDVPTVAFGMTERPDGSPVRMGDRATPVQGLQRSMAYITKAEARIKQCLTAPLLPLEYDQMVDFSYQYGTGALCKSSIVKRANAGDYAGSCQAYLLYKFSAGYDCSTPGNKICSDVWNRSKDRYAACMGAQP
jgi:GH24 family phage-related lysozyme (muramidase)